jgi:hypothetical protein
MNTASKILLGTAAAALMTLSLGCQPPKPPAPVSAENASVASDNTTGSNTTGNTTAGSETPLGETP